MYGVSVVSQGYAGWHLSHEALRTLEDFDMMAQAIMSGWPRDVIAHRRQFILTTHIRIRRLQFLAQLVRMPPTALPRQMLLALHAHLKTRPTHTRPYDGSIFMDIPDPTSMGGIISLVNDDVEWHALCTPTGLGDPKVSTYGVRTRITRSSRDGGPRAGGDGDSGP